MTKFHNKTYNKSLKTQGIAIKQVKQGQKPTTTLIATTQKITNGNPSNRQL